MKIFLNQNSQILKELYLNMFQVTLRKVYLIIIGCAGMH